MSGQIRVIGSDAKTPHVIIAANGGSDLIYLPALGPKGLLNINDKVPSSETKRIKQLGLKISLILSERDYVSGLFANPKLLGRLPEL